VLHKGAFSREELLREIHHLMGTTAGGPAQTR
jgi:hypothetical protein